MTYAKNKLYNFTTFSQNLQHAKQPDIRYNHEYIYEFKLASNQLPITFYDLYIIVNGKTSRFIVFWKTLAVDLYPPYQSF